MERKVLLAVVLLSLVCSLALAQRTCPPPVRAGDRVRVAPDITVVAVECPAGMMDSRHVIEHKMYNSFDNNRSIAMWVRPYPAGPMTELAFILQKGHGNPDNLAGLDVQVRGPDGKQDVRLKRVGDGRYCGHADIAPGWNEVFAWITTPGDAKLVTFNFWGGTMADKPRLVNWVCPKCRVTTVSASCPVCCP